jgi:hypothetical protein
MIYHGKGWQRSQLRSSRTSCRIRLLETILEYEPLHWRDVVQEAHINPNDVFYALRAMRATQLVARVGSHYYITERGKIALAIWRGKQHGRHDRRHGERLQARLQGDGVVQRRAA